MIIRAAIAEDAESIVGIRERAIRMVVAPTGLYSPEKIEAWAAGYTADRVRAFIGEGNYIVAVESGRVVGIARLRVDGTIRGVFVDAGFVGRGIGASLLSRLLEMGAAQGVTRYELVATLSARSFYERHGFVCLEQIRHATPNGAVIPSFRMYLDSKATAITGR